MRILLILLFLPAFCCAQKNDFSLLRAIKINGTASFQFSEAYFTDYVRHSASLEDSIYTKVINIDGIEGLLLRNNKELFSQNTDAVINKISVLTKMTLLFNQELVSIIKYKIIQKTDTSNIKLFVAQKRVDKWIELQEKIEIVESVKLILRLKIDIFSQLEYEEVGDSYKDLVIIAKQVKDIDGTLNLKKLSDNILNNKDLFKKYLDN